MARLLATTALIGGLFIAPALAQTTPPSNPPPAAAQKAQTTAAKPKAMTNASGSSAARHSSKAGDNSADELNRQELSQLQSH
jgi:hypothetical protein